MSKKDEYFTMMETQIKKWDADVDKLRAKSDQMSVDDLLSFYSQGALTCEELVFKVAQLVSRQNVAEIMSRIPKTCILVFRHWSSTPYPVDGVLLGGNTSPQEASEIRERLKGGHIIIQEWFSKSATTMATSG